tara:strand:- start:16 stop:549 length:534 start_codon:yes stop_codon:yes gene_type:complete
MTLQEKLQIIQATLVAPKNLRNTFGNYNYRSCEGILESVKPLLSKHGVTLILTDEVKAVNNFVYCEATVKLFDGATTIEVKAQAGIAETKKGMDISQIYGAASSYARKYALNGLFLIDDSKDADSQDNRVNNNNVNKKPDLLGDKLEKAITFVKGGGSIAAIKAKYTISSANIKKFD